MKYKVKVELKSRNCSKLIQIVTNHHLQWYKGINFEKAKQLACLVSKQITKCIIYVSLLFLLCAFRLKGEQWMHCGNVFKS